MHEPVANAPLAAKREALKANLSTLIAAEDWVRLSFAAQMLLDFDQQLTRPTQNRLPTGRPNAYVREGKR